MKRFTNGLLTNIECEQEINTLVRNRKIFFDIIELRKTSLELGSPTLQIISQLLKTDCIITFELSEQTHNSLHLISNRRINLLILLDLLFELSLKQFDLLMNFIQLV